MIKSIIDSLWKSVTIGFVMERANMWLGSQFLYVFFENNLITILIALLAINAATMGIVLTKISDLVAQAKSSFVFSRTKKHMLLSIQEQIFLIVIGIILLSVKSSPKINSIDDLTVYCNVGLSAVFVYALLILYDTAKSIFVLLNINLYNQK